MRNPFIQVAAMAAAMTAAFQENKIRDFYKGAAPLTNYRRTGHPGSKRPAWMIRAENRRRNKRARMARRAQA